MEGLRGYIMIYRKLTHWGWYKNSVVKDTFLHCLLSANFTDRSFEDIVVKKGQFITSYESLANELGFSVQQIRTALKKLKKTGELTIKSTNKYTLITVNNWADYQFTDADKSDAENIQLTNKQQTNNNKLIMDKNEYNAEKEDKDKNEPADDFEPVDNGDNLPKAIGGTIGKGVLVLSEDQIGKLLEIMPVNIFDRYCEKLSGWILRNNRVVKNHYAQIKKWYCQDYGGEDLWM